jgi:cysteine desulfuration protein SufE
MASATAPLPESLAQIVHRFQRQTDPKRRYELLLWYARRLPALPEADKQPEARVPGCVSQVYVIASLEADRVQFRGDSDSQLTKGLLALLVEGLQGLTPAEILEVTPNFIQETGLGVSLTPSRANGFYNIFKTMKEKALGLLLEVQSDSNPGSASGDSKLEENSLESHP